MNPQQPVQQPMQQQPVQQQPTQPQPMQQVYVEEEKGSVFKGIMKFILGIIIIAMIAALCYGVWLLYKFAMAKGYLF